MHIGTVCKGTVSPEFFTQWLRFYFWGFILAHVICLVLTGKLVKNNLLDLQEKAMCALVQR